MGFVPRAALYNSLQDLETSSDWSDIYNIFIHAKFSEFERQVYKMAKERLPDICANIWRHPSDAGMTYASGF